ncbi:MAG: hypothetical protein IJI57_09470 [Flexilinea sp.]|nr:hypothetical protein [Flexilinea sp.]
MSTYEATISMMKNLPENDILLVKEFVSRLLTKSSEQKIASDPFKPLTREEIIEQLVIAQTHAKEGKTIEAHSASDLIRSKYGL